VATTVYWYSSAPVRPYYRMPPAVKRLPGSEVRRGEFDVPLPDTGVWWIAGPFDVAATPTFPLSKGFNPAKPLDGNEWRKADAIRGFVEFNHAFRPEPTNKNSPTLVDVAAIAHGTLVSPTAGKARLTLGWDDRLTLVVNDNSPIELGQQTYFQSRTIDVPVVQGANRISIRLTNTTGLTRGAWNFSFSAVSPEGKAMLPVREE
jgi:hypothetical protein